MTMKITGNYGGYAGKGNKVAFNRSADCLKTTRTSGTKQNPAIRNGKKEQNERPVKKAVSLKQRGFSGTGSVGGICLPDFNDKYVFSKQESNVSDEEYRRRIVEQAYKDFENGVFQNQSEGFNRLMKNFTSEVSPDRKGIITSGLKAVSRDRRNVKKPIDFVATLLEGKVKYRKAPSVNREYIEFYDKNGEMVATYSNNGWTMYTTNAEAARQIEMCTIYNEAWGNAKKGLC